MDAEHNHPLATDEAIQLVAGHCRFVSAQLPHNVVAGKTARLYLDNLADACRRGVPDLFGSPTNSLEAAASYGLLPEATSPKVASAMVRILAGLSPLVALRGPRSCTLWVTHALDTDLQRELRRVTPKSFLVRTRIPRPREPTARKRLVASITRLEAELEEAQRERDEARHELSWSRFQANEQLLELRSTNDALRAEVEGLRRQLSRSEREIRRLTRRHEVAARDSDALRRRCEEAEEAVLEIRQEPAFIKYAATLEELARTREELSAARADVERLRSANGERELLRRRADTADADSRQRRGPESGSRADVAGSASQDAPREVEPPASVSPPTSDDELPEDEGCSSSSDNEDGAGLQEMPKWLVDEYRRDFERRRKAKASVSPARPGSGFTQVVTRYGDDERGSESSTSGGEQPTSKKKTGRNDSCSCGSGQKYKRCCGK